MRLFCIKNDSYITLVGAGIGGEEISEADYNRILAALENRPSETEEIGYRLRTDLTWEPFAIEPSPEPEPEPSVEDKAEAYDILMGGAE